MSEFVPEEWKSVKFKDVFNDYKYGPRFSSKDYDDSGNVKTIRGTDVSSVGEIKYQQVPTAKLDRNLVDNNKLCNGDLVMITTADCGVTAVFYEQKIPYIASAYAIRLTPSKDISSEYIKFFMQTFNAKKQVESLVRKGTVANLPGSDVMSLALKLPPLPEQQKIAAILTSVDEVIEKTQAQINKLKDLKTGMMQELLTRGVGVDGKPHTEFKDSPVGRIPKAWDVVPLEDLVNVEKKITYGIVQAGPHYEGGVPYIRVSDMSSRILTKKGMLLTSPEIASKFERSSVRAGDIVYALRGMIGHVHIVPSELNGANLTQGTARISPSENINTDYLLWAMRSPYVALQNDLEAKGSTFKEVTLASLRQIQIAVPSDREQQCISSSLSSIESRIYAVEDKLNHSKALKKALMQDLLTGKVRIKVEG